MRWYVSRNGETVGPVEEHEVAEWVRGGMRDASVRDEHGGAWMPVAASPFASILPPDARAAKQRRGAQLALLAIVGTLAFGWWYACNSYSRSSSNYDAKFCAENLSYYETYCRDWPDHCKEGPRKLARCDP